MDTKAFWKSYVTLLAISAIWYGLEFIEFGTLCWDRKCDNVVGLLFFIALWYANHKANYWMVMFIRISKSNNLSNKMNQTDGDNEENVNL